MAVYVVVDVEVKDADGFAQYRDAVPAIVRRHGGEYLTRGGRTEIIEGDWQPGRNDPDYLPLKALRQRVSSADIVMVDGV